MTEARKKFQLQPALDIHVTRYELLVHAVVLPLFDIWGEEKMRVDWQSLFIYYLNIPPHRFREISATDTILSIY